MDRKFILITGCSTGIGLCLAEGLHQLEYDVIASCRTQSDCDKLIAAGVKSIVLDLNHSTSIHNAVEEVKKLTDNRLYGLINNGAYGQPGAVEDLSRTSLRDQFETNVFGTQELTNLIIPMMRVMDDARIIQISSILGFVCLKYRGAYNASKYALEALTDTMRLELADTPIKLSLVEPGPITSHFRQNAYTKFVEHIDMDNSVHSANYEAVKQRLISDDPVKYNLPAESVLKAVVHALQSSHPKIRYRITLPTRIMAPLKRILPDRLMDQFLTRQ